MIEARYEIVEQDQEARDEILSYVMVRHLLQGVAYFCLVDSRRAMSPTEIREYLGLREPAYADKFNEALEALLGKGLVRQSEGVAGA